MQTSGAEAPARGATPPGPLDLYLGWGKVGMLGFGGVTPWARRIVVEERAWLDDAEYAALLGIAQVLPGPNVPNACVLLGQRFCGFAGAAASIAGLMSVPLAAILVIAAAYGALGASATFQTAVGGAASAAAGLVLGTGSKMARGARLAPVQIGVCAAMIVSVGLFGVPLLWALAAFGPASVLLAHFGRRP